jgi:hypothetical protein
MDTNRPGAKIDGRGRRRSKPRLLRAAAGKFGVLLIALIALMGAIPLITTGRVWNAVLALFTGAVLVASLHAARPDGRAALVGLALALADFAIGECAVHFGTRWLYPLQMALWLTTLVYVIAMILEAVFDSDVVTVETLQASLCIYLLIGLVGAFGFALIDFILPGSFPPAHGPSVSWSDEHSRSMQFMRLVVFSYATLSGSSYGEISAATGLAANAASLEAMTGQIYLAVVIARLVGLQAAPPSR